MTRANSEHDKAGAKNRHPFHTNCTDGNLEANKVLTYLSKRGLDTCAMSLDDFDPNSLSFLKDWCDKNVIVKEDATELNRGELTVKDDDRQDVQHSTNTTTGCGRSRDKEKDISQALLGHEALAVEKMPLTIGAAERQTPSQIRNLEDMEGDMAGTFALQDWKDIVASLSSSLPAQVQDSQSSLQQHFNQVNQRYGENGEPSNDTFTQNQQEELDMMISDQLEPWQRILFEKIQQQQRSIERCQKQIETLTQLLAIQIAMSQQSKDETLKQNSNNDTHPEPNSQQRVVSSSTPSPRRTPSLPPQQQPQHQHHQQQHDRIVHHESILSLMGHVLEKIFHAPRSAYRYMLSTRPVRVLRLLHREARDFRFPLNPDQPLLDIHLIIKLFFICLLLRARIGSLEKREYRMFHKNDENGVIRDFMTIWKQHGKVLLFFAATVVYMIRTGMILFLYRVIFKDNVIAKVWKNEDLIHEHDAMEDESVENHHGGVEEQHQDQDQDQEHQGESENDMMHLHHHHHRHPRENQNQVHEEDMVQRHLPHDNEENNHHQGVARNRDIHQLNNNHAPRAVPQRFAAAVARRGGLAAVPNFHVALENTFVGGGLVDRPLDGEQVEHGNVPVEEMFLGHMLEGFKDVLYFVGSFFLSIIPIWRPRARPNDVGHPRPILFQVNPLARNPPMGRQEEQDMDVHDPNEHYLNNRQVENIEKVDANDVTREKQHEEEEEEEDEEKDNQSLDDADTLTRNETTG